MTSDRRLTLAVVSAGTAMLLLDVFLAAALVVLVAAVVAWPLLRRLRSST